MATKRRKLASKFTYHRPVLTDVLPFEVPPSFSNGGFFHFLVRFDVRFEHKGAEVWVKWTSASTEIDATISILFGTAIKTAYSFETGRETRDGISYAFRKWKLNSKWTRPFNFNISHKENDYRQLTIIHPRNQLLVADFYDKNSSQILYYCSKSDYSIRRPSSVAKTTKYADRLHNSLKSSYADTVEQADREYENLGSYFVYRRYSNIFKFYEHYKYHNAEKKFDRLLKLDISKCFDSVYTHSLPWIILGKEACKSSLKESVKTFGGRFDSLMQGMNQGETNGIVIGPEFSRVFSEVILQGVDAQLKNKLLRDDDLLNRRDYEIFRYVDDYFVFYNKSEVSEKVERYLSIYLKEVKLSLNSEKSDHYEKPIITKLTIAKNRTRDVLKKNILIAEEEREDPDDSSGLVKHYVYKVKSNSLITEFKTVLSETGVSYKDILNYTFSALERSTNSIFDAYEKNHTVHNKPSSLSKALLGLLEFCFFTYASNPRVNFSVRLTRILATMVDRLNSLGISRDIKDYLYKYAFDNIVRQLKVSSQKEFREVETLYLILALKKLGRGYRIQEAALASYLGIVVENNEYKRYKSLDYFSTTVLLMYMAGRRNYEKLQRFVEEDVLNTFTKREAYVSVDAELVMLFLDLQCCPYISTGTRQKLAEFYSLSVHELPFLKRASNHWFTNWEDFDLTLELDKKRTREVY